MSVRVVVVDDDFRVASVHAAVAEGIAGVEVVGQATSLAQARQLLSAGADLVIADEYLPDGSGTDLVGASDAAVLLVTASSDPAIVRRAITRGVAGYIIKPFPLPLLSQRIATYVRLHNELVSLAHPDQDSIDRLLGIEHSATFARVVPKGRSAVTAEAVTYLLRDSGETMTAAGVASAIGISRATAQRYLSDLVEAGSVRLALRYGVAGRPEHSYTWVGEQTGSGRKGMPSLRGG
ncbi:MAG: response regulator [Propionibacteriaceae bacterium]